MEPVAVVVVPNRPVHVVQFPQADPVVEAVVHRADVQLQVGPGGAARAERRVDKADGGDSRVGEGAAAGAEKEVEEVEGVEVQEGGGGQALSDKFTSCSTVQFDFSIRVL